MFKNLTDCLWHIIIIITFFVINAQKKKRIFPKVLFWAASAILFYSFPLSVCVSVCVTVSVCVPVCLSVCGHYTSKSNWASSTKFGILSYKIKISSGIAYEQNRPTGVASALSAQFGLPVKNGLKMCCTRTFSQKKVVTNHNIQLLVQKFFDHPTGLASALIAQFVFLVNSALKMHCTKIIFRQ